jgi:hypothetical protein
VGPEFVAEIPGIFVVVLENGFFKFDDPDGIGKRIRAVFHRNLFLFAEGGLSRRSNGSCAAK